MIGMIKSSFEQHFDILQSSSLWSSSESLITSVSGELLLKRCFWWRQLLQNRLSSEPLSSNALSFLLVDSIALIYSFRTYTLIKTLKILSMVLHTWTNISISNWQFLIPCYHQNLKGNVKHTLFQQLLATLFTVYNSLSPKKYINRMFHKKPWALCQK